MIFKYHSFTSEVMGKVTVEGGEFVVTILVIKLLYRFVLQWKHGCFSFGYPVGPVPNVALSYNTIG